MDPLDANLRPMVNAGMIKSFVDRLIAIAIACAGHPVAHRPHPRHRSRSNEGASSIVIADTGHRSTQMPHAVQSGADRTGSYTGLKYFSRASPSRVIPFMEAQQQGQQLHMLERCFTFDDACTRPASSARLMIASASSASIFLPMPFVM